MKLKKLISAILLAALFCTAVLPVSAAISADSYSLSEVRPASADGPITVKVAIADEGEGASYDTITAYVGGKAVASGTRVGDAQTEIVLPANTFVPGVNTVEYKATLNGELYKTVTKKVNAYKEVNDAVTILGADYDDMSSITVSGWENKDASWGANITQIIGDTNTINAVKLEQSGTNKYLKYAPTGEGDTYLRMRWTESDAYTSGIIKLSADIYVPDAETIKKTNIYCYTGSHQFDISGYLKAEQWNKVSWLFNMDRKTYQVYIDGIGGEANEWSVGVPESLSLSTKELRSEIYVNSGKYIYIDNLKLEHLSADYDALGVSAPAEATNTAKLKIRPYKNGTVKTYVDGVLIATDTAQAGEEIVKTISSAEYNEGIKNIKVFGELEGDVAITKYAQINFKKRVESGIGTASGEVIDFNNLGEDFATQVSAIITANAAETNGITKIAGKSGKEGDWAALFDFGTVTTQDYDGGIVEIAGTANQRTALKAKGGKFVAEFDMMFFESSPNLYLKLPIGLWGPEPKSQCFMDSGTNKLRNTETAIKKDIWHSFKMVYDIDNNLWSVWFDNTLQTLTNAKEDYTTYNGDSIRFRIGRRPGVYQNKLALDNLRFYHVEEGAAISSLSYGENKIDNFAMPCGEQNVNIELDREYASDSFSVYKDGVLADGFSVNTSDNKTYTVSGNFIENSEYKIVIGNVSVPLYVTNNNGIYLKIYGGGMKDGEYVSHIESISTSAVEGDIKVLTAVYNGNRLVAVNIEDLAVGTKITGAKKGLTYVGTATNGKTMIWNDFEPMITSPDVTPEQ